MVQIQGYSFLLVFTSNYGPRTHRLATLHERDQRPTVNQPNQQHHDMIYHNMHLSLVRCIKTVRGGKWYHGSPGAEFPISVQQ